MPRSLLRLALGLTLALLLADIVLMMFSQKLLRTRQPGVRLVYRVQSTTPSLTPDNIAEALTKRLDPNGIQHIDFHPAGDGRIEVLIPQRVDVAEAKRMLRASGVLSFYVAVENQSVEGADIMLVRMQSHGIGPKPQPGDRLKWLPLDQPSPGLVEATFGGRNYLLAYATPDKSMTNDDPNRPWAINTARPGVDPQTGQRIIMFTFDQRGANLFGELTESNIGHPLAIVLNDVVITTPLINERIAAGGVINGGRNGFTEKEVNYLVCMLSAGALPVRLSDEPEVEEKTTLTLGPSWKIRVFLRAFAAMLAFVAVLLLIALWWTRPATELRAARR